MSFRKALYVTGLALVLAGCSQQPNDYKKYAKLNDDNKPDIVETKANNEWGYIGIDITARLSRADGSYSEKKVLARFPEEPYHWELQDRNNDGLDDLVYTKRINEDTFKTYVKYNTGGEFGNSRPLD